MPEKQIIATKSFHPKGLPPHLRGLSNNRMLNSNNSTNQLLTLTAKEDVSQIEAVSYADNNEFIIARGSKVAAIGIVRPVALNNEAEIITSGTIQLDRNLDEGLTIYLGTGTPSLVTTITTQGVIQKIGYMLDNNVMMVDIEEPHYILNRI